MEYQDLEPITQADAQRLIESGTIDEISTALVRAVHSNHDVTWSLGAGATVASRPDPALKRIAATCIGHLGRLREDLDVDAAARVLERLWKTDDAFVRGAVEDALDDLEVYRGVTLTFEDA